jgi:hypothetical protein
MLGTKMTKINKYIIVIIASIFCFSIPAFAGPELKDGLYNYLLVKLDNGNKRFAIAPVIYNHETLKNQIVMNERDLISKILAAGELEIKGGKFLRLNETAGIIEDKPLLAEGLFDNPGAGIKNIKAYMIEDAEFAGYFFKDTKFIKYDQNNKHLEQWLAEAKKFRHELRNFMASFDGVLKALISYPDEEDVLKSFLPDYAERMRKMEASFKRFFPEASEDWDKLYSYAQKLETEKNVPAGLLEQASSTLVIIDNKYSDMGDSFLCLGTVSNYTADKSSKAGDLEAELSSYLKTSGTIEELADKFINNIADNNGVIDQKSADILMSGGLYKYLLQDEKMATDMVFIGALLVKGLQDRTLKIEYAGGLDLVFDAFGSTGLVSTGIDGFLPTKENMELLNDKIRELKLTEKSVLAKFILK